VQDDNEFQMPPGDAYHALAAHQPLNGSLSPDSVDGMPGADVREVLEMFELNEVDPAVVCPEDIELIQGMVQPRVRSQWLHVAGCPVTPNSDLTVRDTAWLVLDQLKRSTTTFKATTDWLRMMARAGTLCKPNGPHEPNKFPPSLDVCQQPIQFGCWHAGVGGSFVVSILIWAAIPRCC
jgi:hypothetical protein